MKLIAAVSRDAPSVISGRVRVPGDKSISHRSIMLGALSDRVTEVSGFLEGADALATLNAFRNMGVNISTPHNGELTIQGVGMHGLSAPIKPLDLGNSGTSMRLLAGLLVGQSFDSTLIGDESLSVRPMERVAIPLRLMGAEIDTASGGRPPMTIKGGRSLRAIDYTLPIASAQVKSCVLLAGMYARGATSVTEPAPTRDHTERMMAGFGYPCVRNGATAIVQGGGKLRGGQIDIPADISSAAFFLVAASIATNADITLLHVGINPTRTGVIDILRLMGADITLDNEQDVGGEPVADITVKSAALKAVTIPAELVPLAIDEFPAIFIAAACASGTTVVTGAEELRVKESDRIQAMVDGLVALNVTAQGTEDGAIIEGVGQDGMLGAGIEGSVEIPCHHDHRIAMAFAIASLRAGCEIVVPHCDNIMTSFPNFVDLANRIGLRLSISEA